MRSTRRKNWLIKRMVLGLAVAAFAAPVAQARVDEGITGQPNSVAEVQKATGYSAFVTDFPSVQTKIQNDVVRADNPAIDKVSGGFQTDIVRADNPAIDKVSGGFQTDVVRADNPATDKVELVGTQPRSIGEPQAVASSFDWSDAGIGAGLALALVLLGGGAVLATRHLGREQTA